MPRRRMPGSPVSQIRHQRSGDGRQQGQQKVDPVTSIGLRGIVQWQLAFNQMRTRDIRSAREGSVGNRYDRVLMFALAFCVLVAASDAPGQTIPKRPPSNDDVSITEKRLYELFAQGRNAEALSVANEVLRMREAEVPPNNKSIARALNDVSTLLTSYAEYDRALAFLLRA